MTKKSIGIPVKPPEAECQDERCAWHGSLPVRGMVFQGTVRSAKAKDTVVVEWGYTHLVPKYERYERRRSRVVVHNPECMKAREGDEVIIAECRPLSKTKNFVVVAVTKRRAEKAEFRVAEIEARAEAEARAREKPEEKARPENPPEKPEKEEAKPEKPPEKDKPKKKPEKEKRHKPAKKHKKEAPKKPAKKAKLVRKTKK
jgi:small subunit ribosomal protein S17